MEEVGQTLTSLRSLELMFSFEETSERRKSIADLASALRRPKSTQEYMLVEGSLLSQKTKVDYYLWFHIDRVDEANKKRLFLHLRFRLKPPGNPPKKLEDLKAAGKTIEWLMTELSGMANNKPTTVLVDAELALKGWARRQLPPVAAPLSVDDTLLEICGAEYTSKTNKSGILNFRWSERKDSLMRTWLSYICQINLGEGDVWRAENARCVRYLKELI